MAGYIAWGPVYIYTIASIPMGLGILLHCSLVHLLGLGCILFLACYVPLLAMLPPAEGIVD